jgi:hypothetical protein
MSQDIMDQANREQRLERARRARAIVLLFVGLLALSGLFEAYCIFRIARAHDVSVSTIWNLATMRNTERLLRSFAGYEVVLLDYLASAVCELGACAIVALVLAIQRGPTRRQSAIVAHVVGNGPAGPTI